MPVRSLNSSVLKWPGKRTVDRAVRHWAEKIVRSRPDVLAIAYFGSYARGDWGVGSDLDLVMIVKESPGPFTERACEWDTTDLPVPVDLLVYTEDEWGSMKERNRFREAVEKEGVWVYLRL
ncbi:MAG: nucleotidyltransferase domain-containing protein [Bacillota bacterium]|nr:nucleotidyltransferase domain-containing protein [Bacillota bacterium]